MRSVAWIRIQELREVVDDHVIDAALHGTQQVVRQVGYVNSLVNYQMICHPCERVYIFQHRGHCPEALGPLGFVIPVDVRRSIKVIDN